MWRVLVQCPRTTAGFGLFFPQLRPKALRLTAADDTPAGPHCTDMAVPHRQSSVRHWERQGCGCR